jgi:hypothetical protein
MRGPFASSSVSSARGTGHANRAKRVPARSHVLRTVLLAWLALIPLPAAEASNVIGDQFELGTTFSLPLPAASANRDEIGLDVGLSCAAKTNTIVSFGANIAYHYWPVSAGWKQGFNEFLSERTLNTLRLGGGTWGLRVVQLGVHFRFAAPPTQAARPWLQVGGSSYHVDPHTSGYSGDAGFFRVTAPPLERTKHLGCSVAVGADLFGAGSARMGLDATYHFVNCSDNYGENLQVFTVGAHALFGW